MVLPEVQNHRLVLLKVKNHSSLTDKQRSLSQVSQKWRNHIWFCTTPLFFREQDKRWRPIQYMHSKQKRNFTEPLKKVRQMTKSLQMCSKFQKKNKKIRRTFKGSSPRYTGRSFFLRNLFKFRRAKNRFCRKRRNLQSFVLKVKVLALGFV